MLLSSSRFEQEVLLEDVVIDSPSFPGAAASTPMEESVIRISFLCTKRFATFVVPNWPQITVGWLVGFEEWKGEGFPDLIFCQGGLGGTKPKVRRASGSTWGRSRGDSRQFLGCPEGSGEGTREISGSKIFFHLWRREGCHG